MRIRTFRPSQSLFVSSLLVLIIGMLLDCSTNIDRLVAISVTDHQTSGATNSMDQIIKQRNVTSNQSSDIRDIRKLRSEEVQLLGIWAKDLAEQLHRVNLRL